MVQNSRIKDICLGAMAYAAQYLTIWFIVGSFHKFFSGITILGPLMGLYGTSGGLCVWSFIALLRSFSHISHYSLMQLVSVYHIPTQAAAWYWKAFDGQRRGGRKIFAFRVLFAGIPLVCMGLFMMHPVGWQAAPYTFYWIVPAIVAGMPSPNRWLRSLGSTFTAHAIGSVLWIWTHPSMTAALWLGLIPVVACERILFATAMWGCSYIIDAGLVWGSNLSKTVGVYLAREKSEVAL